ncbi:hypothetical protein [Ramlibacter algicola]|uniref:Uncharacterized protein n=1 Tax=Ramlibacter algicola TaxID=2795217 RepID=A0A934PYD8_9BURK|nr:hypothetical protein [Ramlibacter algicola]MBK0391860.1 hypothetical protein [Ramlibacter algicola]
MTATPRTPDVQDPARDDGLSPAADDGVTGMPDGPGPHDVPDDKVIERTLPTSKPSRDDDKPAR